MEIPAWLTTRPVAARRRVAFPPGRDGKTSLRKARFLDATLNHIVSFIGDTIFNEHSSTRNGFFQKIEPRIKLITLLLFIVVLSLQKSVEGIAVFLFLAVLGAGASRISLPVFLKRLLPAAVITFFIALPALLNLVVQGHPLVVLFRLEGPLRIGPVVLPAEIAVTREGLKSAATLFLRVVSSVSLVLLLTMTTPPSAFIKSLSSLVPGSLKSVVSISYRYIFFLVRKVEQFVMGMKSRQIAVVSSAKERRWVASRIGLLFSISMELSTELAMAMESRGYQREGPLVRSSQGSLRTLSGKDAGWLVFSVLFAGVMLWKSLA